MGGDPGLKIIWAALPLVGLLLAAAFAIMLVDRWRKRPRIQLPGDQDHLTQFRELYEQGELSKEEYDRIRQRLGQRLLRKHPENQPPTQPPSLPTPPQSSPPPLEPENPTSLE